MKRGAIVTAMYKRPYRDRWPPQASRRNRDGARRRSAGHRRHGSRTVAPATIPAGVNAMFDSMMKATDRPALGTHGEVFRRRRNRSASRSARKIGVDLANAGAAIENVASTCERDTRFRACFGLRYVQRSDALMAFTRFDTTCTIEMTGAGAGARGTSTTAHGPRSTRPRHSVHAALGQGEQHDLRQRAPPLGLGRGRVARRAPVTLIRPAAGCFRTIAVEVRTARLAGC